MLRVRFHGRGGQGMKTASRILGSAAFAAGLEAQDSPTYGAERRGAPMAAFTRISREPILERGAVERPHLVVVADETLVDDPATGASKGRREDTPMLVNARAASRLALPEPILRADFTAMALEATGRLSALSTALGAAAASSSGLDEEHCRAGIEAELGEELGRGDELAANVNLAHEVYRLARAWAPVPWPHDQEQEDSEAELVDVTLDPPRRAAPSIYAAANSPARRTGSWRQFRPVLEEDKCNRCWLCFVWCPEAAITLDENELPHVSYDVCKGCLLCAHECPTHAFRVEREVRA